MDEVRENRLGDSEEELVPLKYIHMCSPGSKSARGLRLKVPCLDGVRDAKEGPNKILTYKWSSVDWNLLERDTSFPFDFHLGERRSENDCIAPIRARWEADSNDLFKL